MVAMLYLLIILQLIVVIQMLQLWFVSKYRKFVYM